MEIDEETLEVQAVVVTTSNIGDAPILPEFLNQITPDPDIGSLTAPSRQHRVAMRLPGSRWGLWHSQISDAIAGRNAHATILPRKNDKPWKPTSTGAIAQNKAANTRDICAGPSGDDGAEITAEAALWPNLSGHCFAMPCQPADEPHQSSWPVPEGQRLRPAGRANPGPRRCAQPLHRSWHPRHRPHRISPYGKGGVRSPQSWTKAMSPTR